MKVSISIATAKSARILRC